MSSIKSVPDFIPGHKSSKDILVLGQCPSSNTKPTKNGTFVRLRGWMDWVGEPAWSFHNVIPNKINSYNMSDVDEDQLEAAVRGKKVVIALGGFVSRVCKKYGIRHIKIDHPSPRNRNLNSLEYEITMLNELQFQIAVCKDVYGA